MSQISSRVQKPVLLFVSSVCETASENVGAQLYSVKKVFTGRMGPGLDSLLLDLQGESRRPEAGI